MNEKKKITKREQVNRDMIENKIYIHVYKYKDSIGTREVASLLHHFDLRVNMIQLCLFSEQ